MIILGANATNFKGYTHINVSFDPKLTYLIGPNGAGKSGIGVDLIWWVLQGIAEKSSGGNIPLLGERFRFIGKDSAAAIGEVKLFDEQKNTEIRVIRKMLKSGSELSFSTAAVGLKLDQKWLNDLFNVFFIAPKRFLDLSSKEQALTLGIDTKKWDDQIRDLKADVTILNKDITKIEELPVVEEVKAIKLEPLQAQRSELLQNFSALHQRNQAANKATRLAWEEEKKEWELFEKHFNDEQKNLRLQNERIAQVLEFLVEVGYTGTEVTNFHSSKLAMQLPDIYAENFYSAEPTDLQYQPDDYVPGPTEKVYIRELPDQSAVTDLQQMIIAATEVNIKAAAYDEYVKKLDDKEVLQKTLLDNKKKQADLEEEKLDYIKAFDLPFSKLSIGDEGELLFNGRPLKPSHFSTGELIRTIPVLLSSLNPTLKYVFLQDFSLLDEANQKRTISELVGLGFQLVIEHVGTEPMADKTCIVLKNNRVIGEHKGNNDELLPLDRPSPDEIVDTLPEADNQTESSIN